MKTRHIKKTDEQIISELAHKINANLKRSLKRKRKDRAIIALRISPRELDVIGEVLNRITIMCYFEHKGTKLTVKHTPGEALII